MVPMSLRPKGSASLLVVAIALPGFLFILGLLPLWPCPSCMDLDIGVLRGDICDGGRRADKSGIRNISALKRWQAIRALRAEGCRPIPFFP